MINVELSVQVEGQARNHGYPPLSAASSVQLRHHQKRLLKGRDSANHPIADHPPMAANASGHMISQVSHSPTGNGTAVSSAPHVINPPKPSVKSVDPSRQGNAGRVGTYFTTYDPMTGVRTAAMLGSLLFILVLYIAYKSKCQKRRPEENTWTEDDTKWCQKYQEKYEEKVIFRERLNSDNPQPTSEREHVLKAQKSIDKTRNWVKTQSFCSDMEEGDRRLLDTRHRLSMQSREHSISMEDLASAGRVPDIELIVSCDSIEEKPPLRPSDTDAIGRKRYKKSHSMDVHTLQVRRVPTKSHSVDTSMHDDEQFHHLNLPRVWITDMDAIDSHVPVKLPGSKPRTRPKLRRQKSARTDSGNLIDLEGSDAEHVPASGNPDNLPHPRHAPLLRSTSSPTRQDSQDRARRKHSPHRRRRDSEEHSRPKRSSRHITSMPQLHPQSSCDSSNMTLLQPHPPQPPRSPLLHSPKSLDVVGSARMIGSCGRSDSIPCSMYLPVTPSYSGPPSPDPQLSPRSQKVKMKKFATRSADSAAEPNKPILPNASSKGCYQSVPSIPQEGDKHAQYKPKRSQKELKAFIMPPGTSQLCVPGAAGQSAVRLPQDPPQIMYHVIPHSPTHSPRTPPNRRQSSDPGTMPFDGAGQNRRMTDPSTYSGAHKKRDSWAEQRKHHSNPDQSLDAKPYLSSSNNQKSLSKDEISVHITPHTPEEESGDPSMVLPQASESSYSIYMTPMSTPPDDPIPLEEFADFTKKMTELSEKPAPTASSPLVNSISRV